MKKLVIAIVILAFATSLPAFAQFEDVEGFRIGFMYNWLMNSDSKDRLGEAWGAEFEYSLGELVPNGLDNNDVSAYAAYEKYDKSFNNFDNSLEVFGFGFKLRTGKGANPMNRGSYGGISLGYAFFNGDVANTYESNGKIQYGIFLGANATDHWYGEIAYKDSDDWNGRDVARWTATIGYRF